MRGGRRQPAGEKKSPRLFALDALRGLIIVLMALDHANHFIAQKHSSGEYWGGAFPAYPDALSFLTRFFTHLAAPGFFFLMGAGMLLFARSRRRQGWSEWAIIGHFVARGGLLIALQLLVVNRAWELSPSGWALETYVGVLFALGGTMILGSLILWLNPKYLLALAAALFLGTEFLTPNPGRWNDAFSTLQHLLLVPGGSFELWVNYPVLPWLEVVTFGMVFGHWLAADSRQAFKRGFWLGAAFLLAFVVLRALDGFGNIRPREGNDWIAFFNAVKYPPSLTFTLLTTGVNLIVLWLFSQVGERVQRFIRMLAAFGRVPLFFYLTHLFLYAGLGIWLTPGGTGLPVMYLYWLLGLLLLYPLCLGYGRFKGLQPANSMWRFL
ncbi:MAG: DUF1624 domain-containing protein [Anaerolineae bacterium]